MKKSILFKFLIIVLLGLGFVKFANAADDYYPPVYYGSSCYYEKDDSTVYYCNKKLEEADFSSFEVLNEDATTYYKYAKDKNNVYLSGRIIEGIDPDTFEILEIKSDYGFYGSYYIYVKDKNNVYLSGRIIEGADPDTFEILDIIGFGVYSKDKNSVYLSGRIIEGADPDTFESLGELGGELGAYTRDKDSVYLSGRVIEGADPDTFELLDLDGDGGLGIYSGIYSRDKNNVYLGGKIIEDADPDSFELFDLEGRAGYARDKDALYCFGARRAEGVDFDTYEVIDTVYEKDKNSLYSYCNKLEDSDPNTLEKIEGSFYKDKNNIYYQGAALDTDYGSFKILGIGYSKDKNKIFHNNKTLEYADYDSFEILRGSEEKYCGAYYNYADAWDENYVYSKGKISCDKVDANAEKIDYYYSNGEKMYRAYFYDLYKYPYRTSIEKLGKMGVVKGYNTSSYGSYSYYRPKQEINRAEFLKIVLEASGVEIEEDKYKYCFHDVKKEWFAKYICYAKKKGYVDGYANGFYYPSKSIKYAEALKIIYEVNGNSGKTNPSGKEWFAKYVEDAMDFEISLPELIGKNNHLLTRGEMAEIIVRYMKVYLEEQEEDQTEE